MTCNDDTTRALTSTFPHFSYLCCHRFEAAPESCQKKRENGPTSLTAGGGERERILNDGGDERASIATDKRLRLTSTPAAMATLSDLKEMKEALDAGLVSQAEFDDVKREYLGAKKEAFEFQKKELRAKEGALEIQRKGVSMRQKMELLETKEAFEANRELQKRELIAKEAFHQANIESLNMDLRSKKEALEASKECQKREMIAKEVFLKREPIIKEAFQQRKSEAELRTHALEAIVKHGSSLMSEEQKVDLVRDYAKMSGLDGSAEKYARASKRQRVSAEKRDASPPQPPTPPAAAPAPVVAKQARPPRPRRSKRFRSMSALVKEKEAAAAASEDGNYSDDDGVDDSDCDEPRAAKGRKWTEEEDAILVAALRAGQKVSTIKATQNTSCSCCCCSTSR